MILSAQTIRDLCGTKGRLYHVHHNYECQTYTPIIDPFFERTVHEGMTFGLGPCGYDIRIAEDVIMYPHDFKLASSLESFQIPDWLCMKILDKSSWARLGLNVKNTVAEPGWKGYLTLELTNEHNTDKIHLSKGMPIAQVQFEALDLPTTQPYRGKYQNQAPGPQPAILEETPEVRVHDLGINYSEV